MLLCFISVQSLQLFGEIIKRELNVSLGGISALALDGEEAVKALIAQRCKILGIRYGAGTERQLLIGSLAGLDTVLCMGMYDIILEHMHRLNRILTAKHYKVCGVEVDLCALCIDTLEYSAQLDGGFGTGLGREAYADRIAVFTELLDAAADVLILGAFRIIRYVTDMSCNDVGIKVACEIHHAHCALDVGGIISVIGKIHTEIGAERGEGQTAIANEAKQVAAVVGSEVFGSKLALGNVGLQTLGAHIACTESGILEGYTE